MADNKKKNRQMHECIDAQKFYSSRNSLVVDKDNNLVSRKSFTRLRSYNRRRTQILIELSRYLLALKVANYPLYIMGRETGSKELIIFIFHKTK